VPDAIGRTRASVGAWSAELASSQQPGRRPSLAGVAVVLVQSGEDVFIGGARLECRGVQAAQFCGQVVVAAERLQERGQRDPVFLTLLFPTRRTFTITVTGR